MIDFKSNAEEPQMLVVSDLDDMFLPQSSDLLCDLEECKDVIQVLLEKIPVMFENSKITANALGAALKAAYEVIVFFFINHSHLLAERL